MARFDLTKNERFSLIKNSGLTKLQVILGWKSADLDASAFMLGQNGVIDHDSDFIYYKSRNRSEPFDQQKFTNRKIWMEKTRPMSNDGSLLGSFDDRGDKDDDDCSEIMEVDLDIVGANISEIIFVVTIHTADNNSSFKDVKDPFILVKNLENGEEILRYNLSEIFNNETAVEVGKLICNEDGEWDFEAVGKGYEGGLQTFVDMYT